MTVLGVSSIYKYPRNVIKAIEESARLGFRHINIFAYPPHFKEDSEEFVNKVCRSLFEYGIDCSIKIQSYTINIAAVNPNLRKKSIDEILYWIDVAEKINCSAIIIRAGMFFYAERVFRDRTYERLIKDLREIIDRAHEIGLDVFIENYPYPFDLIVLPSDFIRLSRDLHTKIYLALNIPHLYDIYKSRRINIETELKHGLPWIKMAYISEYINPWDYPHKPANEERKKYEEFIKSTLNTVRRGELGLIVVIGYDTDDIIKGRKYLLDMSFS